MTKIELDELLKEPKIPVSEGVPADDDVNAETYINYWEYLWEDNTASGINYNTTVTYQISIISDVPRCKALLYLKKRLNEMGLFPTIQHEYDTETRRWHSFFALEVLENV